MLNVDKSIVNAIDCAIADYLKANNVTREAMSQEMGMSSNSLRWKREGKYDWTWAEVLKLSEILGLTVDELTAYESVGEAV